MHNEMSDQELSLTDKDFAGKLKDILSAKYGLIALNEPVLHTAVANAAALNFIITQLNTYHRQQRDNTLAEHQAFRDSMDDTLRYFEKNLVRNIQHAITDTCHTHIEEFRVISHKQSAQVKHVVDHDLPEALMTFSSYAIPVKETANLMWFGAGAALSLITTLLTFCIVY